MKLTRRNFFTSAAGLAVPVFAKPSSPATRLAKQESIVPIDGDIQHLLCADTRTCPLLSLLVGLGKCHPIRHPEKDGLYTQIFSKQVHLSPNTKAYRSRAIRQAAQNMAIDIERLFLLGRRCKIIMPGYAFRSMSGLGEIIKREVSFSDLWHHPGERVIFAGESIFEECGGSSDGCFDLKAVFPITPDILLPVILHHPALDDKNSPIRAVSIHWPDISMRFVGETPLKHREVSTDWGEYPIHQLVGEYALELKNPWRHFKVAR